MRKYRDQLKLSMLSIRSRWHGYTHTCMHMPLHTRTHNQTRTYVHAGVTACSGDRGGGEGSGRSGGNGSGGGGGGGGERQQERKNGTAQTEATEPATRQDGGTVQVSRRCRSTNWAIGISVGLLSVALSVVTHDGMIYTVCGWFG